MLPAEIATPLAMVLNELLLNAVEHGFAAGGSDGEVVISAHRFRRQLHVTVADNGRGLPDGFDLDSERAAGPADRADPGHGASCAARSRCAPGPRAARRRCMVVPLAKR